jgi:SAM-dependent methyltransferase
MNAPPNFDRVARIYRWAEYLTLGPLLQRTRTHFLPQLTHTRHPVVFGDGDGRFLARLMAQNPALHAVAVDTSAEMLRLLRARCEAVSPDAPTRLTTLHQSALETTPPRDTDLIATHFFLDCLLQTELADLTHRLAQDVRPGTLWLLSDFRIPARGPLRPFARAYIRLLYAAFRILTGLRVTALPDPAAALTTAGFRLKAAHQTLGGILYTELWERQPTSASDYNQLRKATAQPEPHPRHPYLQTMTDYPSPSPEKLDQPRPAPHLSTDALPDPEPAAPSLAEPDPGVFRHQPAARPAPAKS